MGLNVVELEMELEDVFGMRFSDDDRMKCYTIADLVDVIVERGVEHSNPAVTVRERTSRRVRVVTSQLMSWPYRECQESLLLEDIEWERKPTSSGRETKRVRMPRFTRPKDEIRLTPDEQEEDR